jgi:hypothetical protein
VLSCVRTVARVLGAENVAVDLSLEHVGQHHGCEVRGNTRRLGSSPSRQVGSFVWHGDECNYTRLQPYA